MMLYNDFNFMVNSALVSCDRIERSLKETEWFFDEHQEEYKRNLKGLKKMKNSLTFLKRDGRNFNQLSLDNIDSVMDCCYQLRRLVFKVSEVMENENFHFDLGILENEPRVIDHYMNMFKDSMDR